MNKKNPETSLSVCKRSILTGFAGGIIWSFVATVLTYFHFIQFSPKTILVRTWLRVGWTEKWQGALLAILLAGILSMLTALIYFALFRKLTTMWIGAIYGVIIWAAVFFLILPLVRSVPSFSELTKETIITSICLYLLYGVFIGFSISYDYEDTLVNSKTSRTM